MADEGQPAAPSALSDAELRALGMTNNLWALLRDIVGDGPDRNADLNELGGHVHAIQQALMAQAAARAYPKLFRLLGDEGKE